MKRFALVGNPNSGKTTLFNYLTGSTAKVGNWPGVTVERKEGKYTSEYLGEKQEVTIVDLPGIYSLNPFTDEEIVSRNYIINEKPDLVINIVDVTNLERNLFLSTQLLEIDIPVIVALNMNDIAKKEGLEIKVDELTKKLGVVCVPISATSGDGVDKLMARAFAISKHERHGWSVLENDKHFNELFQEVHTIVEPINQLGSHTFHTVKFIEGDEQEYRDHPEVAEQVGKIVEAYFPDEEDKAGKVTELRYEYIRRELPFIQEKTFRASRSDKIDKVLTNKWVGIPIFLFIMFLIFHLTFSENFLFLGGLFSESALEIPVLMNGSGINSPGAMLAAAVELLNELIGNGLESLTASWASWLSGLLVGGVWGGVSAVLGFVPQILVLFLFITILEDTGYMARAAFVMDRALRKFGLGGKSFLPLITCFGCAVPGIMATRTLESEKEKRITIMLSPFFSCGAKLPIWAAFAGVVYGGAYKELVVFGVYLFGVLVSVLASIFLKRFVMKGQTQGFVMELPTYRKPNARNVYNVLSQKLKGYIKRVATVIALSTVVIWFLSSFTFSFRMVDEAEIGLSILGQIGKVINYVFIPLGWAQGEKGWMFTVASLTGLLAKESVLSTLGAFGGPDLVLIGGLSISATFSFMAFNLLTIPCMAAVSAARSELNNKWHFWGTMLFWFLVSYGVSAIMYWSGVYLWLIPIILILLVGTILLMYVPLWNKERLEKRAAAK